MWSQLTGKTQAENLSGYTYIPLDPFSVETKRGRSCPSEESDMNFNYSSLAKSLPDNAVRMSVEQFNASGTVTYGPAGVVQKGEVYRVTVDYTNADTSNIRLWIAKTMENYETKGLQYVDLLMTNDGEYTYNSAVYDVRTERPPQDLVDNFIEYNLPVYVGIGLRVMAEINVLSGDAHISGIGGIGAEVEASHLKGNLILQAIGINGQKVSAAIPIQSELNKTTAQNAIVAISQIKTLIYSEDTVKSARVLGLYMPFPGGQSLVNSIISAISKKGIIWYRPCDQPI